MKQRPFASVFPKCSRRHFLHLIGLQAAGILAAACSPMKVDEEVLGDMTGNKLENTDDAVQQGILKARSSRIAKRAIEPGRHVLKIDNREALLYVPAGHNSEKPSPFALMLHGAGGNAHHGLALLEHYADKNDIVLLAPKSQHATWDVIADDYGVDVQYINRALEQAFERCAVDEKHLAIGGFSDGASYALSLGIINGSLFTHIIAYSPGFMAPTEQTDSPKIYISHGTEDRVLPINSCSRKLVPQLQRARYDVTYREFNGPHTIPPEIAQQSVDWFLANPQ